MKECLEDAVNFYTLASSLNYVFNYDLKDNNTSQERESIKKEVTRDMVKIVDSNAYPGFYHYYKELFHVLPKDIDDNQYLDFKNSLEFNICVSSVILLIDFINKDIVETGESSLDDQNNVSHEQIKNFKIKLLNCKIYGYLQKDKIVKRLTADQVHPINIKDQDPLSNFYIDFKEKGKSETKLKLDNFIGCLNNFKKSTTTQKTLSQDDSVLINKNKFLFTKPNQKNRSKIQDDIALIKSQSDPLIVPKSDRKIDLLIIPKNVETIKWYYYSLLGSCHIWLNEGYQTFGAIENIGQPFTKETGYNCRNLAETFLENLGMMIVHVVEEYKHIEVEDKSNWKTNRNISDKLKYLVRALDTNTSIKCISFGSDEVDWYNDPNGRWSSENINDNITKIFALYQGIKNNTTKDKKEAFNQELGKIDMQFDLFLNSIMDILIDYRETTIEKLKLIYPVRKKNNGGVVAVNFLNNQGRKNNNLLLI
jgi:hypothetical protein